MGKFLLSSEEKLQMAKKYMKKCSACLDIKIMQAGHQRLNACNSSYSGSRGQEDHGSKPAQENSSQNPILKIPNTKKRAGGVAQGKRKKEKCK
jgi:hypothetical protein